MIRLAIITNKLELSTIYNLAN